MDSLRRGLLDNSAMDSINSQRQKANTSLDAKRMLSSSKIASLQQEKANRIDRMIQKLNSLKALHSSHNRSSVATVCFVTRT
jgi:hypothetical protein